MLIPGAKDEKCWLVFRKNHKVPEGVRSRDWEVVSCSCTAGSMLTTMAQSQELLLQGRTSACKVGMRSRARPRRFSICHLFSTAFTRGHPLTFSVACSSWTSNTPPPEPAQCSLSTDSVSGSWQVVSTMHRMG